MSCRNPLKAIGGRSRASGSLGGYFSQFRLVSFPPQLEPSESASSSNLSLAKPRPNSELNGQSPTHAKVQRSVSSSHKQRRYSEQGNAGARLLCLIASSRSMFIKAVQCPQSDDGGAAQRCKRTHLQDYLLVRSGKLVT